ncbi:signal transduction histidine kinase [Pandoraea aquatica]|uniref:Signal transduction histidine kinase n=1 Tax=Pandoraea aquatica TaxID=2508290 RepID=A0A5E4YDK2_9BURK|nr:histidine kinase [Pandoraea aquatica]VVE46819.1 signal transduction histidine kinase [Pandoraea aquatica]
MTSMMKSPQTPQTAQATQAGRVMATRGLWSRFARELAGVLLFNTAIALALWFIGFGGTFIQNLVFAQCIGIAITVFIDGGRRLIWRDARPSMVGFLLLVAFGCAAGLALGIVSGTMLLGLPITMWRPVNGHSMPIVLLIALIATAIGSYHGWSRARIAQLREETAQQALREAAADRQLVYAQLQTLQAQLEPHFLFNVLANLDSLIASDPARARVLLGHLNRFLRASLAATRSESTPLADEFALLEALLAIQQVRFGERLRYAFDLPEDCRTVCVPPMLVQPLVENAVKHGVEPLPHGAVVTVSAWREPEVSGVAHIVVRVTDDGAGFANVHKSPKGHVNPGNDAAARSGGIGLTNIRERLRVLYGDDARLTLTEGVPRGVVATLRLPVASPGQGAEAGSASGRGF